MNWDMIDAHMGAKVITIANQKGGVGKTTLTMNIGSALALQHQRVLLIDSDPQANLTSYLGVTPGEAPYENLRTLDEIYLSKRPMDAAFREMCIAHAPSGIHLLPADRGLSGVEHYLFSRSDRETILCRFLRPLLDHYDFVLIDTPPSLNLLTLNALCASDSVLIPVQPEFFSLEGIVKIRDAMEDVRSRWNSKLKIEGIIANQVTQRRKLTEEVLSALRSEFRDLFFDSMIHDNAPIAESSGHAQSVMQYDRTSRGAKDFAEVARELLRHIQENRK